MVTWTISLQMKLKKKINFYKIYFLKVILMPSIVHLKSFFWASKSTTSFKINLFFHWLIFFLIYIKVNLEILCFVLVTHIFVAFARLFGILLSIVWIIWMESLNLFRLDYNWHPRSTNTNVFDLIFIMSVYALKSEDNATKNS